MRGEGGGQCQHHLPRPPFFFFHTEAAGRGGFRAARGAKLSGRSPSGQGSVVGLVPTAIPASPLQPFLVGQE